MINKNIIIDGKELLENVHLYDSVFHMWLYEFRTNLTKEEYWTPKDDETLEQIIEAYEKSKTKFSSSVINAKYLVLNMDEKQNLNGFLGLDFDEEKKEITLFSLIVTEKQRRNQIGTSMLEHSIIFLKKNYPNYHICSYTSEDNNRSIALHEKLGFTTDKKINDFNCIRLDLNKKD